jgi:toxin ParE1/3/4
MRRVVWQPAAASDINAQLAFIAADSPTGAALVKQRLDSSVERLSAMPVGRPGRVVGTYEFHVVKTSLLVVYAPEPTMLSILRIIHTSRDWPGDSWPGDSWPGDSWPQD